MKEGRRRFLKKAALGGIGVGLAKLSVASDLKQKKASAGNQKFNGPIVLSTWRHGVAANNAAWKILDRNGYALDAVEAGVRIPESDPDVRSVGKGGLPDRNGVVTLDACIMNENYDCGSVTYLENIENPISVARKVMEETPHVMLSGGGALDFAKNQGFKEVKLLTDKSEQDWKNWLQKSDYKPEINSENHDTIGMLALDSKGRLSGACTTSGAAYKYPGRVGDSPLIGAGLYVDGEVGGACATGLGEAVIKACGSHLVVMLMKQNYTPQEACDEAVKHIVKINKGIKNLQVGMLALDVDGNIGASAIHKGFNYAIYSKSVKNELIDAVSLG